MGSKSFKTIRTLIVLLTAITVLIIGLTALSGYGLHLPFLYSVGGTNMSLLSATGLALVAISLLFIGLSGIGEASKIPLWEKLQEILVADLTHPHDKYKETDKLLAELLDKPDLQTVEHKTLLKEQLLARSTDMSIEISTYERKSARILLEIMDRVFAKKEEENDSNNS